MPPRSCSRYSSLSRHRPSSSILDHPLPSRLVKPRPIVHQLSRDLRLDGRIPIRISEFLLHVLQHGRYGESWLPRLSLQLVDTYRRFVVI